MIPFPRQVLMEEAERARMPVAFILSPCRRKEVVRVRRVIIRRLFDRGLSHQQIGRVLKRDHSTIAHHLVDMGLRRRDT